MKLNGALKPRHGASNEGSSPGAEQLRKYRDKRTPKDTCKHAVNACLPQQQQRQQQLYECGVNNNNNSNNKNTNNNNSNRTHLKEHQQQPPQQGPQQSPKQEQWHRKKCDENVLSSGDEGITPNTNSQINTNKTQNRIKSVTGTRTTTIFDYASSHGSGKTPTVIGATPVAATTSAPVAAATEETGANGNHDDDGAIKLRQEQQRNIITRQTNRNSSDNPTLGKHNTELTANDGVGEEFPIAHKHVTSQSRHNKTTHIRRFYCWKEVNKLSLIWKIYEPLVCWRALTLSTVIICRLFNQFKLFLLWLAFFMFTNTANLAGVNSSGGGVIGSCRRVARSCSLANIMRASQSLDRISLKKAFKSRPTFTATTNSVALWLLVYGAAAAILLPQSVLADEGDNFFSPNDIAIGEATTEFDYASRGQKKFGDKCDNTLECGFPGSICDARKKSCQCTEDLPVTNHIDKCGKEAAVNESCFFNEQCEVKYFQTECRDGRCVCRFDMTPIWLKDGTVECKGRQDKKGPETYIDPAMIGVLVGMALMFIIICVVLRLFSQARWRENRTIFNTPNPRLMNVSLLRESKLLHGQERRGSRMSVRAPSRQPSMASLRPHSPNPSLGSRSNSHGSNGSATSLRSTRSNSVSPAINNAHHERKGSTYHPHQHHQQHQQHHHQQHHPPPASVQQQQHHLQQPNIIANPVAESVTVEIIEPEK